MRSPTEEYAEICAAIIRKHIEYLKRLKIDFESERDLRIFGDVW